MLCFVKGNIRLVSHDLGPVVSTHLEKSLAFSQRPGAGKTKITNATFFLMPGQGKSKLGEKIFTFPSLSCSWNKKIKVCGGPSVTVSGKCLL